jgi:hypothetical protein
MQSYDITEECVGDTQSGDKNAKITLSNTVTVPRIAGEDEIINGVCVDAGAA